MGSQRRDVVEVLTHDHREVEEMFDQLKDATDPQERRELVNDVTIELIRHSVAEEMYLYPAVRERIPDGDALADKEIEEHAEVERTLKELERTDAAATKFSALITNLMADVQAHVEEEESTLFPQLAKHSSNEELLELGDRIQEAKAKAPTRPHPSSPSTPPLNKLLAPGAGLVDRIRDHLSGRGQ